MKYEVECARIGFVEVGEGCNGDSLLLWTVFAVLDVRAGGMHDWVEL
jgi:hypothetical protein